MIEQALQVCREATEQGVHPDDVLDMLVGLTDEMKARVQSQLNVLNNPAGNVALARNNAASGPGRGEEKVAGGGPTKVRTRRNSAEKINPPSRSRRNSQPENELAKPPEAA